MDNGAFSFNMPLCLRYISKLVIIDGGYNKETILESDILLFSSVYHN